MRIAIMGAGPAGLYLSYLIKRRDPGAEVRVFEQNGADATFGFGVVFSDRALEFLNEDDPETVLTDLNGRVVLAEGIAQFSDLRFSVPGAKARVHGTYDILNHKIDLHGRMRVDSNISKTETGFKSLLLKVLDPIFKKKKKGEVVPVYIRGTYEKPQFGLDLAQNDQKKPGQ